MYGSLLGDIIGAPYEFDNGPRNKKFNLFGHPRHRYTDDSLLSIAVAEALMELKQVDMNHLPAGKTKKAVCLETIEKSIRKWSFDPAYERIFREYGGGFRKWLLGTGDPEWKSFGNGSAMRGQWPPKEPEKQQNAPVRKNGKQPAAKKDAKPEKASGNVSKQKQSAGGKKTLTVKPASDIQGPNL